MSWMTIMLEIVSMICRSHFWVFRIQICQEGAGRRVINIADTSISAHFSLFLAAPLTIVSNISTSSNIWCSSHDLQVLCLSTFEVRPWTRLLSQGDSDRFLERSVFAVLGSFSSVSDLHLGFLAPCTCHRCKIKICQIRFGKIVNSLNLQKHPRFANCERQMLITHLRWMLIPLSDIEVKPHSHENSQPAFSFGRAGQFSLRWWLCWLWSGWLR